MATIALEPRQRTLAELPFRTKRLDRVDLIRGLVMVIMVLDHVRAYFTEVRFDPTDLTQTNGALFLTRWITHYCAPTFIFLAGASAWIAGTRRTRDDLSRLLLSRGLWLILLEFTVVSFGWYFNLRMEKGLVAQVIWVIGASMVVLSGLIYLPRGAIVALALALVLGHNAFDGIRPESLGGLAVLWRLVHVPGPLGELPVFLMYPLVPWVAVMALGYVAGPFVFSREPGASRRLIRAGIALVAVFVLLRALNLYGDAHPRLEQGDAGTLVLSFLNLTKYPPSLLFLLMTLGPALIALGLADRARGAVADALVVFGRVPFLFYVAHIYLIHALAVFAATTQGLPASSLLILPLPAPEGYGFGLPVIYGVWAAVVLLLYPLCARYAGIKERSRAWWLSYL
jgi:uncharacterized membrane protein